MPYKACVLLLLDHIEVPAGQVVPPRFILAASSPTLRAGGLCCAKPFYARLNAINSRIVICYFDKIIDNIKIVKYTIVMKKVVISLVMLFSVNNIFSQDFSGIIELRNNRMYGTDIVRLQTQLKTLGFDGIGKIDGYYGPLTENIIKIIQYFSGFEQNGKVDKKLWEFIFKEHNISLIKNIHVVSKYNIDIFRKESGRRMGYSTEGGHVDKYYSNDEIRIIYLFLYGEYGKVEYNFYYINSNEFFLIKKSYIYANHLFSYLHKQPGTGEYVFDDEGFEKDTKIEYETYFKSNNNLFQITNGDMGRANINLDELINIIEDEES